MTSVVASQVVCVHFRSCNLYGQFRNRDYCRRPVRKDLDCCWFLSLFVGWMVHSVCQTMRVGQHSSSYASRTTSLCCKLDGLGSLIRKISFTVLLHNCLSWRVSGPSVSHRVSTVHCLFFGGHFLFKAVEDVLCPLSGGFSNPLIKGPGLFN